MAREEREVLWWTRAGVLVAVVAIVVTIAVSANIDFSDEEVVATTPSRSLVNQTTTIEGVITGSVSPGSTPWLAIYRADGIPVPVQRCSFTGNGRVICTNAEFGDKGDGGKSFSFKIQIADSADSDELNRCAPKDRPVSVPSPIAESETITVTRLP
jgi:hypothetical protein